MPEDGDGGIGDIGDLEVRSHGTHEKRMLVTRRR